jgi:hypothetical protein
MTWSPLIKKRKRARPTYLFFRQKGVRCTQMCTYLSMLYSKRILQPCITKLSIFQSICAMTDERDPSTFYKLSRHFTCKLHYIKA